MLKRMLNRILRDIFQIPVLRVPFELACKATLEKYVKQKITEIKRVEAELEKTLSLLDATFELTADGIFVADAHGKIVSFNRKFVNMLRIPEPIIGSQDEAQALMFVVDQLKDPESFLIKVRELYVQPDAESYDVLEFKDGRIFERYSQPQKIREKSVGRVWSFHDITKRKQAEEQLRHDALTGLPNRVLFMERISSALVRVKRGEDYLFAVLFLDIDRFKVVNDSLGHTIGDQLLVAIARRLEACLRPGDMVARLGGDEFTILLEDIQDVETATSVVHRIQKKLKSPFNLSGHEVFAAASIGIAFSMHGYDQPEDLLHDADVTMYRAKAEGKAGRGDVFLPPPSPKRAALELREQFLSCS